MPMMIQKQIAIAARATTVWRFIGTEEGLRQWWGLAIALEAKPGGRCEEHTHWQGRPCYLRGQVTIYEPPYQLALFLQNEDGAAYGLAWTTITLTLTEHAGHTQVTLVQQAFSQGLAAPAIGQMGTTQSPMVGLPAAGNLQQPQNFLPLGAARDASPTLVDGGANPALETQWLAQQETCWHDRLQALTRQVLLAVEASDE